MNDSETAVPSTTLHLLGRFDQPYTGAERELLDLRKLLHGRRPVRLWSDMPVHPFYAGENVTAIQPFARQFPADGTLLIGGSHLQPGAWLKYTRFERIILYYNLSNHLQLFAIVEGVRELTGLEPDLVAVSGLLYRSAGLPGRVIPSLIDLDPFLKVAEDRFSAVKAPGDALLPFTFGRASRDVLSKHHPGDLSLYRMLSGQGASIRILGGACLAPGLKEGDAIELLAAGAEPVPAFYASLDAVFYRTGPFIEAYGRVVLEAMAAGLPVVAHSMGGYAEVIEHGVTGFLIQTQEDAYDAIMSLRESPQLRRKIGQAAQQKAVCMHGAQAIRRDLDFYLY